MANLLVTYLRDRGGKNRITVAASEVLSVWLQNMDTQKISRNLAPSVKNGLFVAFEKENAEKILDLLAKNDKQTLTVLSNITEEIFNLEILQNELKSKIKEAIDAYTGDSMGRSMLVGFLNLDENTVAEKIREEFLNKINEIRSGEGEVYDNAKLKLQNFIESIKNSEGFDVKLNNVKKYAEENLFVEEILNDILKSQITDTNLKEALEKILLNKLDEFEKNMDQQQAFDAWIKNFIKESIDKNHNLIEKLVRERLDEFTEDEFSDFVEEKVNDDLQMIRVNGAIVGGIVGMVLYVIVYLTERAVGL